MENSNVFEPRTRSSAFSPSNTRFFSEEPFIGTFQPSSYSRLSNNRFFESSTKINEDPVRIRESYSANQSSSQYPPQYNSAKNFYSPVDSDLLSEKIIKLENLLNHKDSIIDELKFQKNSLSKEIDNLIYRIKLQEQQKEADQQDFISNIEEFKYREKESEELLRSLQDELDSSSRLIHTLKTQIAGMCPIEDYNSLLHQNEELKASIENLNQQVSGKKLDSKTEFLIFKLQEQIKTLTETNENLTMALNSRPTLKELKDKEFIIKELKEQIKPRASRSRSTSQTRDKNRELIRRDKELHQLENGETPSVPTLNILFTDLMALLKLRNFADVLPKVRELKRKAKCSNLEEKISKLVLDLSPKGMYEPYPSPQQSWKWLIKLVEDYQALTKELSREEKNKAIINKLISSLGLSDKDSITSEVHKLIESSHLVGLILDKLNEMLSRNPNSYLKDFKYLISDLL